MLRRGHWRRWVSCSGFECDAHLVSRRDENAKQKERKIAQFSNEAIKQKIALEEKALFDSLSLSLARAPARPPLSLMFSLLNAPNSTHQQLPENGGGGPGGAISSLFRSLAGTKGSGDPDVAPASSSTAVGPAVSTDSSLASGKAPPLARSDAFQSSANAGKLLGGGTFPETGDPTTGNQVPVPATLSSKAQSAAPADWVPPASGQLAPRDKDYDAESSTLSTAQAKTNNVLNGVTVGARAEAAIEEEEKGANEKEEEEDEEEEEEEAVPAPAAVASAAEPKLPRKRGGAKRAARAARAAAAIEEAREEQALEKKKQKRRKTEETEE